MRNFAALYRIVQTFREHLLAGFSWSVLSSVAMQGAVLLSTVIVARVLGLASFGTYALLLSTVMTVVAVAQAGSGLVATKLVGESLAFGPERVGRILTAFQIFAVSMGAAAAALLFASADVLTSRVLARPELEDPVRLAAVSVLFFVLNVYQIGALQGFGAFREISRAGMLAGASYLALTSFGALLGQLNGALVGFVAASAVRALVFAQALGRARRAHGVPLSLKASMSDFHSVWRFAVPTGLAGVVTMPCLWLVTVAVSRLDNGLELVALLAVSHQLRLAVLQLPSLLNAVSFSVLSRLKGRDESARFRGVFWSNLAMNAGFSALAIIVLIAISDPLLRLFGREFREGQWLLIVLLASVIPEAVAMSLYQLIQSAGRMWQSLFCIAIPRDLGYLLLSLLLLPTHGVIAAAASYFVAQVLSLALTAIATRRLPKPAFAS